MKIQITKVFLQNIFQIILATEFLMIIQKSLTKETFQFKTKVIMIITGYEKRQ